MEAEQVQDLKLLFVILGTFLGVSQGIFLLVNKSAKNNANKFLGVLVLSILPFFLVPFLYRYRLLDNFPYFVGVSRLVPFLIGPLVYLYVRACTQKGFEMRPLLWLHFLPVLFEIFYSMPIFLLSGPEKVAHHVTFSKVGAVIDPPFTYLIKSAVAFVYFAISTKLIFQYRRYVNNSTAAIDTAFHRWLLAFIIVLSFPVLGLLSFVFAQFNAYSSIILFLGLLSFLLSIFIATLVKPQIFHAFPHQMPIPESAEEQKQKYENSRLQTAQKDKYLEKLKTFMATEKPYQSPELTLSQLSEKVKIPAHYLSQIINEKLNCNFLDFVNGYRVEDAKEKLVDPKFEHYTIVSVAYEAGFNSKSTFYAAFKKVTGMTPSKYRKGTEVA